VSTNKQVFQLIVFLGLALGGLIAFIVALREYSSHRLPYHDSFINGRAAEWESYDGAWSLAFGAVHNDSDDHGAKLMTGSYTWRDYLLEADVQVPGNAGDAGLIVRSTDEEQGVDSYSGYYAGLRVPDGSLILGRANYGWTEYQESRMPGGINPWPWYHLRMVAYGCTIAASAVSLDTGASAAVALKEDRNSCARTGRIGLRSIGTGGVWRNVHADVAAAVDLTRLVGGRSVSESKLAPLSLEQVLSSLAGSELKIVKDELRSPQGRSPTQAVSRRIESLRNLLLLAPKEKPVVSVRGVVILSQPILYIEDSTGGASIFAPRAPPLNVGDEIEATGINEPNEFSATLLDASVQVLWPGIPSPPLAITVSQAATGAFDARFVELEADLDTIEQSIKKGLILSLHDGDQRFRAILEGPFEKSVISRLTQASRLRVRGVCVTSSEYTQHTTPFVVLLRSIGDVKQVAGPPWWSKRNLMIMVAGATFLGLLGYLFYIRAEQWRLHAVIEERQRLAHELHDTLAQSFAGIGFQLRAIKKEMPSYLVRIHEQLEMASRLVAHGHQEARRSISTLHPSGFESIELLPALDRTAHAMVAGGSVRVNAVMKGNQRRVPLKLMDVVYRAGIEAIANTIRHAHATHIDLVAEYKATELVLTIEDDGIGFVPDRVSSGFGLLGMKKRIDSVGGTMCIHSAPGGGTRIKVAVSLPRLSVFSITSLRGKQHLSQS
jgi:signal transduction histidine kinase